MEFFDIYRVLPRGEYWVRILFAYLVLGLGFLANILLQGTDAGVLIGQAIVLLASIFTIMTLVVAAVQRTRSAAISPWWTLLLAVPTVGFVALAVFGCLPNIEEA